MTKTTKLIVSLFSLVIFSFFTGTQYATLTAAHDRDDDSRCTPSADCGTTEGTKPVTVSTHYSYSCPSGYTVNDNQDWNKKCKKADYDTKDRDYDLVCPSPDSTYTSNDSHKDCKKKIDNHWKYTDKVKQYKNCSNGWETDPNNESKCRKFDHWDYEHPSSTSCPEGYTKSDNDSDTKCTKQTSESCTVPYIACPTPTEIPNECPESYSCSECLDYPNHGSECSRNMNIYCTEQYQCGDNKDNWNCNCPVSPTVTPEITPEVTPENSPTATPTSAPNVGGGDNGGGNGNPGAPACNDQDPGIPGNLRAQALGGGQVKLTWDDVSGPHNTYAVAYGPSIGNYLYGDPNVGDVNTYTVKALNPGGNYCFYVQAQNGCRGGSPSNVVCTNQPGTIRVLGASDNYNPLVVGIKESYGGEVLGAASELAGTAEVAYSSDKLPSGNILDEGHSIFVPAINIDEPVYLPQKIGDELTVGHHEVLNTTLNGTQLYYGHNATDVFGKLFKIKLGDEVVVNQDGQTLTYKVTATNFVSKADVSSIKTTASDQIVLMTCSYTKPDYRILVTASLIK